MAGNAPVVVASCGTSAETTTVRPGPVKIPQAVSPQSLRASAPPEQLRAAAGARVSRIQASVATT